MRSVVIKIGFALIVATIGATSASANSCSDLEAQVLKGIEEGNQRIANAKSATESCQIGATMARDAIKLLEICPELDPDGLQMHDLIETHESSIECVKSFRLHDGIPLYTETPLGEFRY